MRHHGYTFWSGITQYLLTIRWHTPDAEAFGPGGPGGAGHRAAEYVQVSNASAALHELARVDPRMLRALWAFAGATDERLDDREIVRHLVDEIERATGSLALFARTRATATEGFDSSVVEDIVDLAALADEYEEEDEDEDEPTILFVRAGARCGVHGGTVLSQVTAASPVPAAVLGHLARWGKRPPLDALVHVRVLQPTDSTVTVESDSGREQLELTGVEGAAMAVSRKTLLLWYGDANDLGDAAWDDVQLLDASASGDLPFCLRIRTRSGAGEGVLGLFDVLMTDPDSSVARSARYGVFRSRTPSVKFVLPELDVERISILIDDGEDDTPDTLDLTTFVDLAGDVTAVDFPGWVERDEGSCPGEVNESTGRRRMVTEEEQDHDLPGDCAVFMLGENRLCLLLGDELLMCAHSFHYVDPEQTVPSGHPVIATTQTETGEAFEYLEGCLALDFVEDTDDGTLSMLTRAAELRPHALAGRFKLLEGKVHAAHDYGALCGLADELQGHNEACLESVSLSPYSPVDPDDLGVLERVPEALHANFNAGNDTFGNAALHWHHFVIHTFPAHRLIERILLPQSRPAVVALSGVQFATNKTFVRPAAFDAIRRIRELYEQDPARKMAIFGHTDTVGGEDSNNHLSLSRARSVSALLHGEAGYWFDRFQRHTEVVGTARGDQKWVLSRLGYYAGTIDNAESVAYQDAVHAFQRDHSIPEGPANRATRRAMAEELRSTIGATGQPLTHEDRWGMRENQSMLKFLGLYEGPIHGVTTASTRRAVQDFQCGTGLGDDGDVGIVTRAALIDDYMNGMVVDTLAADRFHANAVFGGGEAYPRVPTADGVDAPQNRRVEVLFRREAVEPIDPDNQLGTSCPYLDWQRPEMSEDRPPELPNVVVAVGDSGFGAGDDFRGDPLTLPNRLMIRGDRWVRPTDVSGASSGNPSSHTVAATGDLRALNDASGHGTAVLTCMACDGVGNQVGGAPRTFNTSVLGVAPHVKVRAIQKPNSLWNNLLCLEVVASDPDVKIYSTSSHLYRRHNLGGAMQNFSAAQRRALAERLQDMVGQGKIALASAGNYRTWLVGEYDTATREFGSQAPDRRVSRSHATYAGADAHRQRIAIVGSSAEVSATGPISAPGQRDTVAGHTYLGEQVGIHMPGENIRALAPPASAIGSSGWFGGVAASGMNAGGIGGTSFATPMMAGVIGELMMLDLDLTQPANLARGLEYVEATADPLPNVNGAGGQGAAAGNPRNADPGANAGGPPNGAQSPTAASTYQNIRRVHFWKAVLATLNQGLSAEGRGANGASDAFFTFCTLRDDSATEWYGFEIRSPVPDSLVWWRKSDGTHVLVDDPGALMPGDFTMGSTWRLVDLPELAAGQPLPAYPWTRANFTAAGRRPYYLCQLSVRKDTLADYEALVVYPADIDPLDPEGPAGPPVVAIPVDDRGMLRNPVSAAGNPDVARQALATFAAFSDFIVRVTAVAQAVDGFRFVAQDRRVDAGVGETIALRLYAVDRFGCLAQPGAVTAVTHSGTPGAAGAPNTGVFLNGSPAPAAGVAPTFGAGNDHPGVARLTFTGFNVETVTMSFDDGAGHTGTIDIDVRPAGSLSEFRLELQRRGGGPSVVEQPLQVGDPFELVVTAVDSGGVTVAGFNDEVQLGVQQGEVGHDGPPHPRGLHVKVNAGDPFDATAFGLRLTNGTGTYPLFCYTAGTLQLRVEDEHNHEGDSRQIEIRPGALALLQVQSSTPQTTGNRFPVSVTALDGNGNVVDDYEGSVALSLAPGGGTAGATAADGTRSGTFVGDTALVGDDTYTFAHTDEGQHEFEVACYTAETVRVRATDAAAGHSGDSNDVVVQGSALDHFGFDVRGADRAGTAFEVEVSARDASDQIVADFTGNVSLNLAMGTAYAAGPPARGVWVGVTRPTPGAAVPPATNSHAFVSADHGKFLFHAVPYTAETVQLTATDGTASTSSPAIIIESGSADSLQIITPAGVARNSVLAVQVRAVDRSGNTVLGFTGPVTIQSSRNGGGFNAFVPAQTHTFTSGDGGQFTFQVRLSRRGSFRIRASDGGNLTAISGSFNVT